MDMLRETCLMNTKSVNGIIDSDAKFLWITQSHF